MTTRQRMNELLNRVQQGTALPEDYRALRELIDSDTTGEIVAYVHEFHSRQAVEQPYDAGQWNKVVADILQVDKKGREEMHNGERSYFIWWAAAAIVVLVAGIYFFTQSGKKVTAPAMVKKEAAPILPGKNGALLTLANGHTIVLDSLPDGIITMQGNTRVQLQNGHLQYDRGEANSTVAWNTLRTPRGSQYQVLLPDGTKVWLNAASSLRFPTAFTGADREVEITGEAYLEVAHNDRQPFRVKVRDNIVEVLGTHFNINAYDDEEQVATTLLEGKVKVSSMVNGQWSILKPGQQAVCFHHSPFTVHDNVDVDAVVAWKNGFFHFDGAALQTVMRQLSRWYDVDVVYEGHPDTSMTFSGKMGRDLKLAQVLKILQKSEVHFNIRERKIVVMP